VSEQLALPSVPRLCSKPASTPLLLSRTAASSSAYLSRACAVEKWRPQPAGRYSALSRVPTPWPEGELRDSGALFRWSNPLVPLRICDWGAWDVRPCVTHGVCMGLCVSELLCAPRVKT
jgi:hypothetical protein